MTNSNFEQAMQELRKEYRQALPDRVAEVEQEWHKVRDGDWSQGDFRTLVRFAHNLAGSGATYGLMPVSRSARELELYVKGLANAPLPLEEAEPEIEARLAALRACLTEEEPASATV
jgi:chemotaxis protein histidine kinase CheA